MRLLYIDRPWSIHISYRDQLRLTLWHGDTTLPILPRLFPGDVDLPPITIVRTGHVWPDVFMIPVSDLILDATIAERLRPLPGVHLRPVEFARIIDLTEAISDDDCVAAGDDPDGFLDRCPLMAGATPERSYLHLLPLRTKETRDVGGFLVRKESFRQPIHLIVKEQLRFDEALFEAYAAVKYSTGVLVSEPVGRVLEPYLLPLREYFDARWVEPERAE